MADTHESLKPLRVSVPAILTQEMVERLKDNPNTRIEDPAKWRETLGWLYEAWPTILGVSIPTLKQAQGNL